MDKLGLDDGERSKRTAALLQRKLRDSGWGLTPAARTSPAAFLGSLAACCSEPVFSQYCGDTPVPHASQLHGLVDDSMRRVRQAAPGDEYQSALDPLLQATAGLLFHHYSTCERSTTTTLQKQLNVKATTHDMKAAVQALEEKAWGGGGGRGQVGVGPSAGHHRTGCLDVESGTA